MKINFLIWIIALLFVYACNGQKKRDDSLNILVISKTAEFRHKSIPEGLDALWNISLQRNWIMTATEDSLLISPEVLDSIDVVVFLLTSGNILGVEQQQALKQFITSGGGLVTIHSGTDTEKEWPWFTEAIGAIFTGHPPVQEGRLIIEDRQHPATSFFPDNEWLITEEWYSFDRNPRKNVRVLISIDESSYDVGNNQRFEGAEQTMGDHPIAWCRQMENGRVFQTALGHVPELYADPLFLKHIEGAIQWAAGHD